MLPTAAVAAGWLVIPVAAALLALALASLLRPLTDALGVVPKASQLPLAYAAPQLHPEPDEQALYLLCLAVPPVVVWALSRLARRLPRPADAALVRGAVVVQAALGIAIALTFAYQQLEVHAYFPLARWGSGLLLVGAVAWVWRRYGERWRAAARLRATAALAAAGAAAWAAAHLSSAVYDDVSIFDAPATVTLHLPTTLGEFAGVLAGRTPGVDFFPQYVSLLPYALAPVFRATGLTVHTFTLAMAALSLVALLLQYDVLRRVTGRPWTALALFAPAVALAFQPVELFPDGALAHAFTYFAVGPLRYFGPWVVGWLVAWHLSRPSAVRALLVFAAGGASVLNNLDWGIPALGAAALALGLTALSQRRPARAVAGIAVTAATGIAAAVLLFQGLTFLRSGRPASLAEMTVFQRVYGVLGLGALPLPAWGVHWVVYLTFMLGIGTAVVRLEALRSCADADDAVARRERLLDGVLVYGGVFGAGALSYYVGRSHWAVLPAVFGAWGFVLVTLAWLALRAAPRAWRGGRLGLLPAALGVAALALCAGEMLPGREPLTSLNVRGDGGPAVANVVQAPELARTLRDFVAPGEKVMIVLPAGHLVAYLTGVENVYPFVDEGSCAVVGQVDEIVAALRANGVTKYFGRAWPELRARVAAERLPVTFFLDVGPGG